MFTPGSEINTLDDRHQRFGIVLGGWLASGSAVPSVGVPINPNSVFLVVVTLVAIFLLSFWFFWKRN
jgi:hypothetical protein